MKQQGMDPQRGSLLVTRLFADIVPGELAVVRLLDVARDRAALPQEETGRTAPCPEDSNRTCTIVSQPEPGAWMKLAREAPGTRRTNYGVLERSNSPSVTDFKAQLDSHLKQDIGNSLFELAFSSAQGIFDEHGQETGRPQVVVWLSDGRPDNPELLQQVLAEMRNDGIVVEAIIFGKGHEEAAREAGLSPKRVDGPAATMTAFADVFRKIVGAPYGIDSTIQAAPGFEMAASLEEAWVVVYGDESLSGATLQGPDGAVPVNTASGTAGKAGTYYVVHLPAPKPGRWNIEAAGGGREVAYAVVQRSGLMPELLAPRITLSGAEATLEVGIRAGDSGDLLADPTLMRELVVIAELQGQRVSLNDDGRAGDAVAGDGRFSGMHRFTGAGVVEVAISAKNYLIDQQSTATVEVSGTFSYIGPPVSLDLGVLTESDRSCKPLAFPAEQEGEVPFRFSVTRPLPPAHTLTMQADGTPLLTEGTLQGPETTWTLCLETGPLAMSSSASGEQWAMLAVSGSSEAAHQVPLLLTWTVDGVPWWQRYLRWLLTLITLLIVAIILWGYLSSSAFQPRAAVTLYDPSYPEDRNEFNIRQYRGTRRGWFRDAVVFVGNDGNIAGLKRFRRKPSGAAVELRASGQQIRIKPIGFTIEQRSLDGSWEPVPDDAAASSGQTYRLQGQDQFAFEVRNA